MSLLNLTLADFKEQLPFSAAIEQTQLAPYVKSSYTLDVLPLLGYGPLEGIELLTPAPIAEYAAGGAVSSGDLVARRERVYRALAASPTQPPPAVGWVYEPLYTLWAEYLKRYWIQASFGRFLAQTGFDFTKAGLTTPTDPNGTFRPVSSTDRATVQASIDTVTEALRSRLTAFLRAESVAYVRDPLTGYDYGQAQQTCCTSSTTHRTRLRGINRRPA